MKQLLLCVLFPFFFCAGLASQSTLQKIDIQPGMINHSGESGSSAAFLFDGLTSTFWFPGWHSSAYPARVVLDLGRQVRLRNIQIWDGTGQSQLHFAGALRVSDLPVDFLNVRLEYWQHWQSKSVDATVRFVTISLADAQGEQAVGEIEFYADQNATDPGTNNDPNTVESNGVKPLRNGDAQRIGINGFHWIPTEHIQPFAWYREYQMWQWMENQEGKNRFEPTDLGNGRYDIHYEELKSKGIRPVACVNTSPAWMSAGYPWSYSVLDYRPARVWENPAAPRAYREFARFCWQLAARYGRIKHPNQKLSVNETPRWTNDWPVNRPKSGLDLLEYIEVWNEPDKWWMKNTAAYLEPEHYAALLSACYDGHEGALGPGIGVKNADPSMNVVMAGLTNFDLDYLKRMIAWFEANRKDRRFPADVVNFHHYSNYNQGLYQGFTRGISPEADHLRDKLKPLVDWCRAKVPGAPFWLSEFGYDTRQESPQRAVPFGKHDAIEVQAMWLQRSYLEAIAAGVDVCFAYNLSDTNHGYGLFESSGLLQNEQNGFAHKNSWYKIKELADHLDGLRFEKDVSPNASVRMYRFVKENGQKMLAIWATGDPAQGVLLRSKAGEVVMDGWPRFVAESME